MTRAEVLALTLDEYDAYRQVYERMAREAEEEG